jgi:hypothetical protein
MLDVLEEDDFNELAESKNNLLASFNGANLTERAKKLFNMPSAPLTSYTLNKTIRR